jgi:uncharacterized protein with HEPN domain
MPDKQDLIRLRHMLDAGRKAIRLAEGQDRSVLDDEDDPLADALVRLVSVIGEAANRLSESTRSELADIPWPDVIGMRHRLIHAYFDVDLDILWATVQDSLPTLAESLKVALEKDEQS